MQPKLFTFQEVIERYRQLLLRHPGQALVLGDGCIAMLRSAQAVVGARIDTRTGHPDLGTEFEFSPGAFHHGHWEEEDIEDTVAAFENPSFIDIASLRRDALPIADVLDPVLSSLPVAELRFIEDQLSNNDTASDDELKRHFLLHGLSEDQSVRAVGYRCDYRSNLFLEGHTPILKGHQALRFNPRRQQFEALGR